jgi:hypothetical protein
MKELTSANVRAKCNTPFMPCLDERLYFFANVFRITSEKELYRVTREVMANI